VGPHATTPPSIREAEYLVELSLILPKGNVRWRTSALRGFES
jgi:hypothetical protein